tara:strand:+ start:1575 stop:2099 length:525 start_codon:yes stop_codon:yes gene_type:complete
MDTIALLRSHLDRLHGSLDSSIIDLSPEELHWKPSNGCNHIGFSLWHYVRTEDNLISFVLQNRKPTVWIENGWYEYFNLDRISQGTGMSEEDAGNIDISSIDAFMGYMSEVWESTNHYLDSIDEDTLATIFNIRPLGDKTVSEVLFEMILTHGFSHLGEIWVLKGLQGHKGSPI